VSPATARAGELFTLTVRVTNDAGAVIQEINSSVTVEVQNANTQAPGRGTLLTPQFQLLGGQRSISQSYTSSEPIILIARDDAGNAPATSNSITIIPGPPSGIHLASSPSWVGGNKHATLSATVVDVYENGVPGQPVSFAHVSGSGTLTPIEDTTDEAGIARADFLSPRNPERVTFRATSGSFTRDLEVEVALVDPAAAGGYVTNYPNPFHPGETPTTVAWKLADNASVHMRIYTLSGGLVLDREFVAGMPGGNAGLNEVTWDGRNGDGEVVASGGYILLVEAQGAGETLHVMRRKIAVVR
jgi:hypothetical protein